LLRRKPELYTQFPDSLIVDQLSAAEGASPGLTCRTAYQAFDWWGYACGANPLASFDVAMRNTKSASIVR
jgi:hypothetical protein